MDFRGHPLLAEVAVAGVGLDPEQDFRVGVAADVIGQCGIS